MANKTANIVSVSDRLGIATCNVRSAKDFVKLCIQTGDVACLVGSTGIGKTQLMRQVAKELNGLLLPLFLAHREREDIIGIPFPTEGKPTYRFLVEESVHDILSHEGRVIIFLDEFNRADTPVLNATFPMIEDRVYGSIKLPDNVGIAVAMNPSEEGYLVNGCEQDHAFRRRLCFVNVIADHLSWVEYATNEAGFDDDVIAFIRAKPMFLDGENERLAAKVGPNPAAWEKVSNTVKALKKEKGPFSEVARVQGFRNKIAGHIGVTAMVQFMEYATRGEKDRIYPEDLLKRQNKEAINNLKTSVGANKNNVVLEALSGLSLLIITKTPAADQIVDRLADVYEVLSPDMIRSFSQSLVSQAESVGRRPYIEDLSRVVAQHPRCKERMQTMFDATERVRSEIAGNS